MAYTFHEVIIHVFDMHRLRPDRVAPTSVRPDFSFLADPAQYDQRYRSATRVETPSFDVQPLTWRTLRHHHFWKHYKNIHLRRGAPDAWRLQLPFQCRPKSPIAFDPQIRNVEGRVQSVVNVSSVGWSSRIHIRLSGSLSAGALRDFVGRLSGRQHAMFEIANQRLTVGRVFSHLARQLTDEVFSPGHDVIQLKQCVVVAPLHYSGERKRYLGLGDGQQMWDDERALMQSLVLGRSVSVAELARLEQNGRRFLLTHFPPRTSSNFALTHFEPLRVLLFMQDAAIGDQDRGGGRTARRPLICLTANIRDYLITTLSMVNFVRGSAKVAQNNDVIADLREASIDVLAGLRDAYQNPYARSFHDSYGPLHRYW